MIFGFKRETEKLNDRELEAAGIIAAALNRRIGIGNAIKSGAICRAMTERGYKLDDIRLRKMINHIRTAGWCSCLIASNKGYYIASSRDELEEYIASLKAREDAIKQVRFNLEMQAGERWGKEAGDGQQL